MTQEYIELPRFLNKDEIYSSDIKTLELALNEAKEAYIENEGKRLLSEMLSDKDCPSMLKDFVKKHSIYKVEFDKYVQNEDYMPDYGWYIVLSSKDNRFGFLSQIMGCYGDPDTSFEETEFKHDIHFAETIKEYELLVSKDIWTIELTREALKTWDYVLSYSDVGHDRKLYRQGS